MEVILKILKKWDIKQITNLNKKELIENKLELSLTKKNINILTKTAK